MPNPLKEASRTELLVDAALALAVFGASLGLLAAGGSGGHHHTIDAAGVVLTAAASLPLVVRREWPLGVFIFTAVASVALRAVAEPAGPPLGPTIALYFVAARRDASRADTRLALGVAVALLIAHVTAVGLNEGGFPTTPIAFAIVVWGAAWLAGDRSRLRQERISQLEQQILRAERDGERDRRLAVAEERARIARDLHDSVGHAINVILVHAGLGRLRSEPGADARETFTTIEDVARDTVVDIDQLVGALRDEPEDPAVEPPPGLEALETLSRRHRDAGLNVSTTIRGPRRTVAPRVDLGAYRILQEALTNAARHGDGSAAVEIRFEPSALDISVANPLPPAAAPDPGRAGHGLIGMRERAALLGGTLDASIDDGRFRIHARLPLTPIRA